MSPLLIPSRNFRKSVTIGDIVAVNGQPTKGTFVGNFRQIFFRPEAFTSGQAIADITRNSILEFSFEILNIDWNPNRGHHGCRAGPAVLPPSTPGCDAGQCRDSRRHWSVSRSAGPIGPDRNCPNYCGPAGINE